MRITLAEFAAGNPDGTYTLVRGGMSKFWGGLPGVVRTYAAFEADHGEVDDGAGSVTLAIDSLDKVYHLMDGVITLTNHKKEQRIFFAVAFDLIFPAHGEFVLTAKVGDAETRFFFTHAEKP